MKTTIAILLLTMVISTQLFAQQIEPVKPYDHEELLMQFKKIERQVALESVKVRKRWLEENGDFELNYDEADYVVETMIIDSTMSRKLNIVYYNSDYPPVIYEAVEGYDKLLNKYYKILMAKLPKDEAELLRMNQRAWLTFRDTNIKFQDAIFFGNDYYGREGQIYTYPNIILDMYKTRVAELFDYLPLTFKYEISQE